MVGVSLGGRAVQQRWLGYPTSPGEAAGDPGGTAVTSGDAAVTSGDPISLRGDGYVSVEAAYEPSRGLLVRVGGVAVVQGLALEGW